ncbi:hypothetical protein J3R83DRAFT_11099 [Lanmaoa asiatica]|nr:hypothetical protein J3R83DRAFT_11099 [Lanmaoa asiatica]
MLPPAVVEQQAKLGVSAENSKAERLKRQQARFRDRGGSVSPILFDRAFIPSNSNPLVDILLARTVSGESPSKARLKNVAAKRLSASKARRASSTHTAGTVTVIEESQTVAEKSKSKLPASRKRKAKAVEPEDDTAKPAPKRRGRPAKGKKRAPDSDTEQPPPPETKTKTTSKGKGKQRSAASSSSDGKPKPKPKAKAKSNPAKEVVEILVSDDDQTLVDVPHRAKFNPKRNVRYDDDGETGDNIPILGKRAIGEPRASGSKTATRVKTEMIASTGKKTLQDGQERAQNEKYPETIAKKRVIGKAVNSTSAKPKSAVEPDPAPVLRTTEDVKNGNPKVTGKGKGKGRAESKQVIVDVVEDADERSPERVSKPKKRKKEEDNYDDRPQKVVKFAETGPPHSSSQKLKENQSDRKHKSAGKSSIKDEPDAPCSKLGTEPPSRAERSKGPPRAVLERIKASAARYLRCADSEPDELDCLS